MSLETLLEAAQFLEWSNPGPAKARAGEATDLHHYAKSGPETGGRKNSGGSDKSTESAGSDGESRRRPGGAGTREVHNKLEKNRRAHLKECFDNLKQQVPNMEDKKTSNLSILRGALRFIQVLKRKEKELELETQTLARDKIKYQERLNLLKEELTSMSRDIDINLILANSVKQDDNESDSTATAGEDPYLSDDEEMDKKVVVMPTMQVQTNMPPPPTAAGLPKAPMTGMFVVPKVPLAPQTQIKKPQTPIAIQSFNVQTSIPNAVNIGGGAPVVNNVGTPINMTTLQPAKTHVTQILQQTIAQRVQQQQLQMNQQRLQVLQQKGGQVTATATMHQATTSSPQVITLNASNIPLTVRPGPVAQLRPSGTVIGLPGGLVPGTSILTAAPSATHTLPASASTQLTTTPAMVLSKPMAPNVITSTSTLPSTITSPFAPQPLTPVTQTIIAGAPQAPLGGAQSVTQAAVGHKSVALNPQAVTLGTQGVTLGTMKHIIAPQFQAAQYVTTQQIQQLLAQQAARSRGPAPQLVTQAANNMQTVISSIPVTQLVTPVTVVAPNFPMAANNTGLNQAQPAQLYNNALNSQVLRLGQIPIIQQSTLTLPLKPMVVVSMPNVVTTSAAAVAPAAAPVQVAMPTAPNSN